MSEKPLKKAISLIFKEGDKVWVFKRSLQKEAHPGAWSLPSTYIHEDEKVTETAQRVVKRKLGLQSVSLQSEPLGVSPVVEKDTYYLQMADYIVMSYEGILTFDAEEYTQQRLVTAMELLSLINDENEGEMGECTRTYLKSEGVI